jgi:Undecaprenyl-phosphate glucose phosphotransferase
MRAATPKAEPDLRPVVPLPEGATARGRDPVHARHASELAGVTPLRPGLQEGFPRVAANDAARVRPRPLPPVLLGAMVMALDFVLLMAAGMAADLLAAHPQGRHLEVGLLVTVLAIAGGVANCAYGHAILFSGRRQLRRIGTAAIAALAATIAAAAAFGVLWRLDPAWLAASIPLATAALMVGPAGTATLLRQASRTARRTAIIGAGPQATRLVAALRAESVGLDLVGVVDDRGRGADTPHGVALLGGLGQLDQMIRAGQVDVVVLALPWSDEGRMTGLIEHLSAFPVEVRLAPDLLGSRLAPESRPLLPPLVSARPIAGLSALVKTVSDYALASLALLVAAVPMALVALAVKLDSPGPVLFRQTRTGFNDRSFGCFKFRTMYAHATDHEAAQQVRPGDPRVTRIGAILRRTSLDELPQLFNVLRGEMSFVGPRPHAPGTRAGNRRFDEVVANYAARHRVKPGLTGLAQVRGFRGATPTEEEILKRVESDLEYIAHWSLWLDFTIVLRTLLVVVRMQNAH